MECWAEYDILIQNVEWSVVIISDQSSPMSCPALIIVHSLRLSPGSSFVLRRLHCSYLFRFRGFYLTSPAHADSIFLQPSIHSTNFHRVPVLYPALFQALASSSEPQQTKLKLEINRQSKSSISIMSGDDEHCGKSNTGTWNRKCWATMRAISNRTDQKAPWKRQHLSKDQKTVREWPKGSVEQRS